MSSAMMPKMIANTPRNAIAHQFCANRLLIAWSLAGQPGVVPTRSSIIIPISPYWRRARSGSAAFGVIDVFEFGVDDALVSRPGASAGAPVRLGRPLYRFAYPHCRSGKRLGALPDPPGIITGHCGPQCGDCLFDGAPLGVAQLIAVLLQVFFGTVDQRVGLVTRLDHLAPPLVLRGMLLGFADHALNICLGETPRGLDANLLLLAGRLVLGRNVHDAIGVDVEGDLDLRHAARCRRDTDQVELTQQ